MERKTGQGLAWEIHCSVLYALCIYHWISLFLPLFLTPQVYFHSKCKKIDGEILRIRATGETNHFPPSLYAEHMRHGVEYPLGQLGLVVLAVSPPNPLCTPSLLTAGVG